MARRVNHAHADAADLDLLSIAQASIDPLRRHPNFGLMHVDGCSGRAAYEVVVGPVVGVPVGGYDSTDAQVANGVDDLLTLGRHVDDQALPRPRVADDVGVVVVRAQRPDFEDLVITLAMDLHLHPLQADAAVSP